MDTSAVRLRALPRPRKESGYTQTCDSLSDAFRLNDSTLKSCDGFGPGSTGPQIASRRLGAYAGSIRT
jgi:hypothetical protein